MADQTDEEQIETVKQWLNDNGTSLVVGIVLAVGGVFGYQSWQNSEREAGEAASKLFEGMMEAVVVAPNVELDEETIQSSRFIADTLKKDHGSSTYAIFAAMMMAKLAVEDDDLELAAEELRWVLDQKPARVVSVVASIRLARVLLASEKADEAFLIVAPLQAGAHESSRQEVLGDVYVAKGENAKAKAAYQAAIDGNVDGAVKPILEMKMLDVAVPEVARAPVVADAPADAPAEGS